MIFPIKIWDKLVQGFMVFSRTYSENQKTLELEDDFIAIFKCIWTCYKSDSFTICLFNHVLSEMGLFTLHNCCGPYVLDYSKFLIESKSRCTYSRIFWLSLYSKGDWFMTFFRNQSEILLVQIRNTFLEKWLKGLVLNWILQNQGQFSFTFF